MGKEIAKGTIARLPFTIYNASRQPTNPDAGAPNQAQIESIHVNGALTVVAGIAVVQLQDSVPANIPGYFSANIPTANMNSEDQVDVRIRAVVNGATVREVISFTVIERVIGLPFIDAN
jgi:hypothetical protein